MGKGDGLILPCFTFGIFLIQVSEVELKIKFLEMFRKNVNIHLCNRWKRHFHWQICLYIFRLFFYGSSLFSFFKFQPPQMSKQTKRKKKNVHKNVKVKKNYRVFWVLCAFCDLKKASKWNMGSYKLDFDVPSRVGPCSTRDSQVRIVPKVQIM